MCVLIVDAADIDKSWDLNLEDVKLESDDVHKSKLLLERWCKLGEVKLNIAVIGNSGVGKSTFINAIRGLKDAEEEEAAGVSFTEKTVDIRDYPHPNNNSLKFWDLPGVGTDRFPQQTYLVDIDVDYYDFFLLITATRFTENDTWLGNEFSERNKNYFFVRTKIGVDISNDKLAHPRNHSEKGVMRAIRERTQKQLEESGFEDVPVFLIDSHKLQQFDFCRLEKCLINTIPDLKQEKSTLILSLQARNKELIKCKAEAFRSEIYKVAFLSTVSTGEMAKISLYGESVEIDIQRVREHVELYHTQLGLDTVSLKRLAQDTSTDYQQLRAIANRCRGCTDVEGCKKMIKELSKGQASMLTSVLHRIKSSWFPVLRFAAEMGSCYSGTYYALTLMLDHIESVALEVIECSTQHVA